MEFSHISVMLRECMEVLNPQRGGVFVDCTAGGGGHSFEIASLLPEGSKLISLDRDGAAVKACGERLRPFGEKCTVVKSNFSNMCSVLDELGIEKIDGVMWDLGVSSYQLDEAARGFSYMHDAPLDMRMDTGASVSAYDVVNGYEEEKLKKIIFDYGEERFAPFVAGNIVKYRACKPIETTLELAKIISESIPSSSRKKEAQHPAKRTFQAIRIEVNGELEVIRPSLEAAVERLNKGGRACVITFHSGEDRIAKQTFAKLANPCECPRDFPVCICGKKPTIKILTKKPVVPSEDELKTNPRSRSAKVRAVEKL